MPDFVQVWPGHGAGSACGKALGAVPQSTVGYEKRFNWAFGITDEAQFVEAILAGQPAPPTYFAQMKRINKEGPADHRRCLFRSDGWPRAIAAELASRPVVIDTAAGGGLCGRPRSGNIEPPNGQGFLTWAGWLMPYDQPFALIADDARSVAQTLRLIGLDTLLGFWTPDAMEVWTATGQQLATIKQVQPDAARKLVERDEVTLCWTCARQQSTQQGISARAATFRLANCSARLHELPADRQVLVHCQGGLRSAIAASILSGQRTGAVIDLQGGFGHWQAAGNPVDRSEQAMVETVALETQEVANG